MTSPYRIDGPALVSFSGGRTSGYMLWHILDAYGGRLPNDLAVCFANTGKEMPATLDFVRDCGRNWHVDIIWLEYDPAGDHRRKFRVVDHASASRKGEPYEALLRERGYLPNPVSRFCTTMLLCGRPHKSMFSFSLCGGDRLLLLDFVKWRMRTPHKLTSYLAQGYVGLGDLIGMAMVDSLASFAAPPVIPPTKTDFGQLSAEETLSHFYLSCVILAPERVHFVLL